MTVRSSKDIQPAAWVQGRVADVFSSYITAAALSASCELGLLDRLAAEGAMPADGSGGDGDQLDDAVVRAIYRALSWAGVVEVNGNTVSPGQYFDSAYAARGYFYWLVRGCGEIISEAGNLAKVHNRTGDFYRRDMSAVAIGSQLIGDSEVESLFDSILARSNVQKLVDLGCGSGRRVIRLARECRAEQCFGIDISADAVGLALNAVAANGVADRVYIRRADVRDLVQKADTADADVLTCVFLGHDFWPYEDCVRTLKKLRLAFPAAKKLLLCDVVRATGSTDGLTPIFTLGFELVHSLMGVYLPALDEWQKAFAESGWICDETHATKAPPNGYLFELVPAPDKSTDDGEVDA